jgi:DNA-binding NarL/FixJ family response regulator
MRTSRSSVVRSDAPRIVIIDPKKFRQAAIMRLLEAWSEAAGLKMTPVPPHMPFENGRIDTNCEMILVSLGNASVEDPEQLACIKSARLFSPNASIVVLSDREESKEICAAFEAGAAGFLPTSTEPSMALQALSFIRGGGSFFPPSALLQGNARPEMSSVGQQAAINGSHPAEKPRPQCLDRVSLTSKQEEVFKLLRRGEANKLIARHLGMSEATVKVHIRQIMRKLGVANRTQAAICTFNGSASVTGVANGCASLAT